MSFYLSNNSVQPTGFEVAEFLDAPWLPDLRPLEETDEPGDDPLTRPEPS